MPKGARRMGGDMHFKIILILLLLYSTNALASRFISAYPCKDEDRVCEVSGEKIIDGIKVTRDCWQYSYRKTCNYPSKDDCKDFAHCYLVGDLDCLLKDSMGNCVNLSREFSCKSWEPFEKETKTLRTGRLEKDGAEGLVCSGVPCIDGNCVDKSYMTNGEMLDSISKLYATSKMNPDKAGNFNLFQGIGQHCSKKAASYSNCCRANMKGWGKELKAKCSKDENDLAEKRSKNLCIYVGKESKRKMGVKTVVKHRFCCFSNMLDKVVQVEARKQLGMNFGSGSSPNCRGLTLDEIQRVDFSRMDFTEFIEDFKIKFFGRYKAHSNRELGNKIQSSVGSIRNYDDNPNNRNNNMSGWNIKAEGESDE